ncbi:MAG: hypothetical protein HQ579_08925 [Candidatus Omnitrophica bacterium]|nr:hypothetical protein [Candidatus Omnitrophota bacterium]
MKNQTEHLKKTAKKKTLQLKREMDRFYKKHILNSNDPVIIILKTHLYLENCIDRFFLKILPCPDRILKKSFSVKIDFFEALKLGYPPDNTNVVKKLRQINRIRNLFSHNLEKRLTKPDISELIKNIRLDKKAPLTFKLKRALQHFIGYFHALLALNDFFPFLQTYLRNKEIFKQDKGWNNKLMINYPLDDVLTVLTALKMD